VRERRSVRGTARVRAVPRATGDRATYTMRRLDEVRVLAHPLRIKLLELFAAEPRTTKQAAEILGENPTRLYHHVNALERVGLIRLRETRSNRGATEKYFGAVARRIAVDSAMFGPRGPAHAARAEGSMAGGLLDSLREELSAASARTAGLPDDQRPAMMRMTLEASPNRIRAFRAKMLERLEEMVKQCGEPRTEAAAPIRRGTRRDARRTRAQAGRRERWTLTLAFVPTEPGDARSRRGRR